MTRRVEVIGHGGAGHFHPLNSPASIRKAIAIGVDRIEVDVQRSSDGHAVLVHDRVLDYHGTRHRVTDMTYNMVLEVVPGLLTLDTLLAVDDARVPIMLDLKGPGLDLDITSILEKHDAASYMTACSISPRVIRNLSRRFPEMRLALTWGGQAKYLPVKSANRITYPVFGAASLAPFVASAKISGATEATINFRMLNTWLVRALQAADLYVIAWTVDTPDNIRTALRRGVNAVTSNRPDLVIAIMQEDGIERIIR